MCMIEKIHRRIYSFSLGGRKGWVPGIVKKTSDIDVFFFCFLTSIRGKKNAVIIPH